MYIPKYSEIQDIELITEVMRKHSFATVITSQEGEIEANHYPFIVDASGKDFTLLTHLAVSNPQCSHLKNEKKCLVIFNGPHQYISPKYYTSPMNVPTWNYVAIHIQCEVETIVNPIELELLISKTVQHFEAENQTNWNYDLPEKFRDQLLSAIVGFKMSAVKIESKFKLSQNRSKEDYESTIKALSNKTDKGSQELLHYMLKTTPTF